MKIAIVGATGAVGREIVKELEDCLIPDLEIIPIASKRSEARTLSFRDKPVKVKAWSLGLVTGCKYALMSAGEDFSREFAPQIAERGTIVIDNSSAWRMVDQTPLIVPEVNGHLLSFFKRGIISNPNCAAIQLVMTLAPIHRKLPIEQVIVSTYQSASGQGQLGIDNLRAHSIEYLSRNKSKRFDSPVCFNIQPQIGEVDFEGHCDEELKVIYESRKILEKKSLDIIVTTARVPVFNCHCESVVVKITKEATAAEIKTLLQSQQGIYVCEDSFPTLAQITKDNRVWVSRVRTKEGSHKSKWLQFWSAADNLKKGAATNAVQILMKLQERRSS